MDQMLLSRALRADADARIEAELNRTLIEEARVLLSLLKQGLDEIRVRGQRQEALLGEALGFNALIDAVGGILSLPLPLEQETAEAEADLQIA
jgi:hypothetical protein